MYSTRSLSHSHTAYCRASPLHPNHQPCSLRNNAYSAWQHNLHRTTCCKPVWISNIHPTGIHPCLQEAIHAHGNPSMSTGIHPCLREPIHAHGNPSISLLQPPITPSVASASVDTPRPMAPFRRRSLPHEDRGQKTLPHLTWTRK